jgi:hypothetical protein
MCGEARAKKILDVRNPQRSRRRDQAERLLRSREVQANLGQRRDNLNEQEAKRKRCEGGNRKLSEGPQEQQPVDGGARQTAYRCFGGFLGDEYGQLDGE